MQSGYVRLWLQPIGKFPRLYDGDHNGQRVTLMIFRVAKIYGELTFSVKKYTGRFIVSPFGIPALVIGKLPQQKGMQCSHHIPFLYPIR